MWQPVEPKPDGNDELIARHKNRKEVDWVSYAERMNGQRAASGMQIEDDGARVTVTMEVLGLGRLTIIAEAKYSPLLKIIKWDQSAQLSARIE